MARSIVSLVDGVWTNLATGEVVVTVHKSGAGRLLFNNSQTDASSFIIPPGREGHQFANQVPADSFHAKAVGEGWQVAVDA